VASASLAASEGSEPGRGRHRRSRPAAWAAVGATS